MEMTCKERLKALGCLVVIPTYNNEGTILKVVDDVRQYADDILVVNDGCTDSTSSLLAAVPGIQKLEYGKNRGKGGALKLALKYAVEHGYAYMLTIDADGQHFASDIPSFVEAEEQESGTLLIGARNLNADNMPGKNTFANKFSNFWYRVDTAKKMSDTQSGYRLYPLEKIGKMHFFTGKYEFEVEIIVRAAWRKVPVKNIPIKVYYAPAEERVSHFKPARDFTRISLLNTGLFLWAIFIHYPWLALSWFFKGDVKELRHILTSSEEKPWKLALSMGLGVFCGIVPAWGFQAALAGTLAYALKLNKIVAIGFSAFSIPPLIPVIVLGSTKTGAWVTGSENKVLQYVVGSIVLGAIAGLIAAVLGWMVLKIVGMFRRCAAEKEAKS